MNKKDRESLKYRMKMHFTHNTRIHRNCVRLSPANTWEHEEMKIKICWDLLKNKKEFYTEAKFENGLRADIYNATDLEVIEIAKTEKEVSVLRKNLNYPIKIRWVRI